MNEEYYGHWHLDYFSKETDFYTTAIGFWNEEGSWDVFFNELEDNEMYKLFGSLEYKLDKDFGVLLFKANDFDEAHVKFVKWVEEILIPFLERK